MNRLKIKDNSIIAILYVLLLNNNISILFVANNNNNSSILSHKSFIDLLSFLIVLTFFAWYIFLKIGRYFIFTSLAILLVNIQEIAPGPRILVKKYRCTSWSGMWRKRGPIFVSRWALLENIYLGANPVTLSRISRTEIGRGNGGYLIQRHFFYRWTRWRPSSLLGKKEIVRRATCKFVRKFRPPLRL